MLITIITRLKYNIKSSEKKKKIVFEAKHDRVLQAEGFILCVVEFEKILKMLRSTG